MSTLSENVKVELANVLNDKKSAMFVSNGKLFSLEVHDTPSADIKPGDLAQEIEDYSELKESLQRFTDNPEMRRYTAKDLKESRNEQRR